MPETTPVYLDCAATTPIDPRVRDVLLHYLDVEFGNAGSRTHRFGAEARRAVEKARDRIAAVVDCGRGDVVFTSGATEANNLAILGLIDHAHTTQRRHIVTTAIEHSAVLEPMRQLEARGFTVDYLRPTPGGWVDPDAVRAALRPDTLLVSIMHVNNETGVIQPVETVADLLPPDVLFHVDAAQSFGKLVEPLRHPRINLIAASGHKLHAPRGIGCLITRRRNGRRPPLSPLQFGGGQERGLRPGTQPVPLIAAFGLAAELAVSEADDRAVACRRFRNELLEALQPLTPTVHGDAACCVPHIINLSIPGIDNEALIDATADLVAISDGAACSSTSYACSHVLAAMALGGDNLAGAVRMSWCHTTPAPDWAAFTAAVREAMATPDSLKS